jgi:hypothetical protein
MGSCGTSLSQFGQTSDRARSCERFKAVHAFAVVRSRGHLAMVLMLRLRCLTDPRLLALSPAAEQPFCRLWAPLGVKLHCRAVGEERNSRRTSCCHSGRMSPARWPLSSVIRYSSDDEAALLRARLEHERHVVVEIVGADAWRPGSGGKGRARLRAVMADRYIAIGSLLALNVRCRRRASVQKHGPRQCKRPARLTH